MGDRDGRVLDEHAGSMLYLGAGGAVRVNVPSTAGRKNIKSPPTAPTNMAGGR